MRATLRSLLTIGICGFLSLDSSCSTTHTDEGTDSNTHWLERCDVDNDCGGLECLCGVCSVRCEDHGSCSPFGPDARCGEPVDSCSTPICVREETEAAAPDAGDASSSVGRAGTGVAIDDAGERDAAPQIPISGECTGRGFI